MRKHAFLIFAILIGLASCKKDREKTFWKTEVLAPLVKSELSIADLITNQQVVTESDSSLKIVYKDTLMSIGIDSLLGIQDTVIEYGASLSTLELPNDTIADTISFGDLLRAQGLPQALIDALHGQSTTFQPVSNVTAPDVPINNEELFQSMKLDSGTIEIIIDNGFPIDITNLDFMVKNTPTNGGDTILQENFPLISANTSVNRESSIHGKTIWSQLLASLNSLSSPGSPVTPITIDTSDALIVAIVVKDLKPIEATAVWPDQNLIDTLQVISFPPETKTQINLIKVKEGDVEVKVFSSLKDTIYLDFEVPSLQKGGSSFKVSVAVPPAPSTGFSDVTVTQPFGGYDFHFNGLGIESTTGGDYNKNMMTDADTINTYVQLLKARLPYTGKMVKLSLKDTIFMRAGIKNVVAEYAEGYLGKDTITIGPDSINLDIFNNYISGELDLEKVKLDLQIENGVGAAIKGDIVNLSSKNKTSGKTVKLTNTEIDNPILINAATDGGSGYNPPVTSATKTVALNESNSNVDQFIEILPQAFNYEMQVEVNHDIASAPSIPSIISNPPNFVYNDATMRTTLNMEMPLSLIADTLLLVDTLDFSFAGQAENKTKGTFSLHVENGYPFDAITTMYFYDANNVKIDSLWVSQGMPKGTIDPVTKKVTTPTKSVVKFDINPDRLNVLKQATKVVVLIGFHTFELTDTNKEYYKLYSDYKFGLKLIGDFEYEISR